MKEEKKEISKYLEKISTKLFSEGSEKRDFIAALTDSPKDTPAVIWVRDRTENSGLRVLPPFSWQPSFVDRLESDERAGSNPLHEEGSYYCLDMSSVFAASVMTIVPRTPDAVLDLCSSPGGKSIFAWRELHPSLLLCNEVIKKRTAQLISNLRRCRISPVRVASSDSSFFAKETPSAFDLVIVDAPCSGQSLLARGLKSPGCFHPSTINMNANRQKRILANAGAAVRGGGHLVYMTCTYSREENEEVLRWFLKKFPWFQPLPVDAFKDYASPFSDVPCYRLWPHKGEGAGAFTVILQNGNDIQSTLDLEKHRSFFTA